MGLENIRGGYGRCPPFILGSLVIICFILTFNWWSLSAQNYDLIRQLEDLGDQLKLSSDELDRCDRQRGSLESRNKNNEDELARLRVRYEQSHSDANVFENKFKESQMKIEEMEKKIDEVTKQNMINDEQLKALNNEKDDIQNTANLCDSELASLKKLDLSKDATYQTLRIENEKFKTDNEEQKKDIERLNEKIKTLKDEMSALKEKTPDIPPVEPSLPSPKSEPTNDAPLEEGFGQDMDNKENNGAELTDNNDPLQDDRLHDDLDKPLNNNN